MRAALEKLRLRVRLPRQLTQAIEKTYRWTSAQLDAFLGPWLETVRSILSAALLPFVTICATVPYQAWLAIHKAWHSCQTESAILAGVERVAQHQPLYPPVQQFPWIIEIYNPLAYSLAGWIGRLYPNDPQLLLFTGRVISLSFSLILPFLVVFYLSRLIPKGQRQLAWIAVPFILFYHSSILTELIRNRPESIGMCLVFSGWALSQLRPKHWLPLSVLSLLVAFLFKQWFLAAVVAISLDLIRLRQWRTLLHYCSLYFAFLAVFLVGAGVVTQGNYFAHTVSALASNPTHPWAAANDFYPDLIFNHWRMAFPAALLAVAWLFFRKQDHALLIYLFVAFVWATLTAGKAGADLHYHSELSLLLIVTLLVGIVRMVQTRSLWILPILLMLNINGWYMAEKWGFHWNTVFWYRIFSDPNGVVDKPFFYDVEPYVQLYESVPGKKLILNDELATRLNQVEAVDWFLLDLSLQSGLIHESDLMSKIKAHDYTHILNILSGQPSIAARVRKLALENGYHVGLADGKIEELTLGPATPGVPAK